jgi:putative redox protein
MTSGEVSIGHIDGDVYEIHVRGHHLTVDQPIDAGGTDKAPTPTELFAAARIPALTAIAGHCTVHNTLIHPPEVTITIG